MVFVDELTFAMITLVLVAATVAYIVVAELFAYRRLGPKGLGTALKETAVPMIALGLATLVVGFWGMFTWPLPGAYNILFWDVYTLFGLVALGFGLSVFLGFRLQYVGVLSLVSGPIVIAYGARAYDLGLTKEPWAMFLMYLGWGATAILAFPVAVIADDWYRRAAESGAGAAPTIGKDGKPHYPVSYFRAAVVLLFVEEILLSAFATYGIQGNSIYTHLQNPP